MPRPRSRGHAHLTISTFATDRGCRDAGDTTAELEAQLRSGRWRSPSAGYVEAESMRDQRLLARAALQAVRGAVLADESAAHLRTFATADPLPVHLLVPSSHRARTRRGIAVRQADIRDESLSRVGGLPCTSPERTAADLARLRTREQAIAVLDAAVRSTLVTQDSLVRESERSAGLRGSRQLRSLLPHVSGLTEPPMESLLRLRLIDGGIPAPEPQVVVAQARCRVDLGYPQFQVAIEFAGREHHATWSSVRGDKQPDRRLVHAGWLVLHFTAVELWNQPVAVLAEIAAALRSRGWQDA